MTHRTTLRQRLAAAIGSLLALLCAMACLAVLFAPDPSRAALQTDKLVHATVSASLGSMARIVEPDPVKAWGLAMAPGLAKELYDARRGGTGFSVPDLIANAIGAYVGVRVAGLAISRNRITYQRRF